MKDEYLQDNLIKEIKQRLPQSAKLVNELVTMLNIEREAVYRRLRKEVPFTFSEIAIISKTLNISLDNLVGIDNKHRRSAFQLQMTKFIEPQETDFLMMEEYVQIYHIAKNEKGSEMATSSNIIPQTIFAGFPFIRQFYLFKWNYHYEKTKTLKAYHELVIPQKLGDIYDELFLAAKNISKAYHILDHLLFSYLVNDIQFFYSIHLIKEDDVKMIKKELYDLLDYLENLALTGIYKETNNKVYLYISDLNIDSNYFYLQSKTVKISLLSAFILNTASSSDEKTLSDMKKWVNSIIRISNLITYTGEKQRILFFNAQRKLVDQL